MGHFQREPTANTITLINPNGSSQLTSLLSGGMKSRNGPALPISKPPPPPRFPKEGKALLPGPPLGCGKFLSKSLKPPGGRGGLPPSNLFCEKALPLLSFGPVGNAFPCGRTNP